MEASRPRAALGWLEEDWLWLVKGKGCWAVVLDMNTLLWLLCNRANSSQAKIETYNMCRIS